MGLKEKLTELELMRSEKLAKIEKIKEEIDILQKAFHLIKQDEENSNAEENQKKASQNTSLKENEEDKAVDLKAEPKSIDENIKSDSEEIFHLKIYKQVAYMVVRGEEFILCKGADININQPVGNKTIARLREQALRDGRIAKTGKWPNYKTVCNFSFATPTAAAVFVLGGSWNGWISWISATGETLSDYMNKKSTEKFSKVEDKSCNTDLDNYPVKEEVVNDKKGQIETSYAQDTKTEISFSATEYVKEPEEFIINVSDIDNPDSYTIHGYFIHDLFFCCLSYSEVLLSLIRYLNKKEPSVLEKKRKSQMYYAGKKNFISKYTFQLSKPVEIDDGMFLETEGPNKTQLERIAAVLAMYHQPLKSLSILVALNEKRNL